ncbi:hypothetical protein GCM10010464_18540 [Pseudonocardia yunnanensis]
MPYSCSRGGGDERGLEAVDDQPDTERLACGEGYEAHEGDGYVACDEYGAPLHPERVSEEFEREGKRAGLPRIVLHGTRHTSATLLDEEGVPEADNSMWHGHTLGGRVSTTRKHYIHPDVERRLKAAGAVLAAAYRTEHAAGPRRSTTASCSANRCKTQVLT